MVFELEAKKPHKQLLVSTAHGIQQPHNSYSSLPPNKTQLDPFEELPLRSSVMGVMIHSRVVPALGGSLCDIFGKILR